MITTHIKRADKLFGEETYPYLFAVYLVHLLMLVCSFKKSRKLEVVFIFQRTKRHEQCQMSMANKSENLETPIKQCANAKRKESFLKET